jgi:RNA polymerase primary sigma factor
MSTKRFIDTSESSIGKYLKDVRKLDMITAEEELDLAKRIEKGDEIAKEHLIKANLRFVISVAKEYQGQGVPLSDLINEGNYGLTKAAERFDHTKGFRFISYAVWWVKQSILQCLNETSRTVRLPVNITNEMSKVKKEIQKIEQEMGRDVTPNDIDMSVLNQPTCNSLNTPINEEGDEVMDLIADDTYVLPGEDIYGDDVLKSEMDKTLGVLKPRERKIIEMYFGLDGQPMTLEQIGSEYGLTKERIRQIKEKALRELKNNCDNLFEFMYK